ESREHGGEGPLADLVLDLLQRGGARLLRPVRDLLGAVTDLLRQVLGFLGDLLAGLRRGFLGCVHDRLYPLSRRARGRLRQTRDVPAKGGQLLLESVELLPQVRSLRQAPHLPARGPWGPGRSRVNGS